MNSGSSDSIEVQAASAQPPREDPTRSETNGDPIDEIFDRFKDCIDRKFGEFKVFLCKQVAQKRNPEVKAGSRGEKAEIQRQLTKTVLV